MIRLPAYRVLKGRVVAVPMGEEGRMAPTDKMGLRERRCMSGFGYCRPMQADDCCKSRSTVAAASRFTWSIPMEALSRSWTMGAPVGMGGGEVRGAVEGWEAVEILLG